MAQMNIDLERLGSIGQEDLSDRKVQKRLYQYLYQLSEQLKYWQYHLEEENLAPELAEKIEEAAGDDDGEGIEVTDQDGNPTMTVGENGDIVCNSVTTNTLTVGGQDIGTLINAIIDKRIIISETQPDETGVIWVQPGPSQSGTASTVDYTATGTGQSMNHETDTVTMTFDRSGSEPAGGTDCTYGIYFRVYNINNSGFLDNITVTATGTDGNGDSQTVTVYSAHPGQYVGTGSVVTINTLASPSAELVNITHGSTISVSVTLGFAYTGNRFVMREAFTLRCTGEETEPQDHEVRACTVHYIS